MLNAKIVVLLSCSAIKLGPGLFPEACRMHKALVRSGVTAVLGPTGIFTLSFDLVDQCLDCVLSGMPLDEVASYLEGWQSGIRLRRETFAVVGSANLRLRDELVPRSKNNLAVRLVEGQELVNEYRRIGIGLVELSDFQLQASGIDEFRSVYSSSFNTLSRALVEIEKQSTLSGLVCARLSDFKKEADLIGASAVDRVAAESRASYFWLAAKHGGFNVVSRCAARCEMCKFPSEIMVLRHVIRGDILRSQAICSVCGVTKDLEPDLAEASFQMRDARWIDDQWETTLVFDPGKARGYFQFGASVNNAQSFLVDVEFHLSDGRHVNSTLALVDQMRSLTIRLQDPPLGVHYAQIFLMRNLRLSCFSVPLKIIDRN